MKQIKIRKLFETTKSGGPPCSIRSAVFTVKNRRDSFGFDIYEMADGKLKIFIPSDEKNRILEG